MEWVLIVETIIKLIQDCRKKQSEAEVVSRIQRGGPFVTAVIRRALVRQGIRGDALRDALDKIESDRCCMSQDEISDIVRDPDGIAGQ